MTYEAKSNGKKIDVEIIRKNNKNVYFRVKEDLHLHVTCPIFLKEKSILKLLEENEESILKMYEKMEEKVKEDELFWYLGKRYNIKIDEALDNVTFDGDEVITPSMEALDAFYKSEVVRVFTSEVEVVKKCFSTLPEFTLKFRRMKTRWGVCTPSKCQVTLNTELLKKDITLLDYVIVHELCHFYEGNHGKNFWHLVSLAYPNYKEARRMLRS